MKRTGKCLTLTVIVFFIQLGCYCQNDTILKPGYANIATLIVDYDTYHFEGGNLSYYNCSNCNNDSLPFLINILYHSTDDYEITFNLNSTYDTIFNASTYFMGKGQINYPIEFSINYPFRKLDMSVLKPLDIKHVNYYGSIEGDLQFINKADSAWYIIDSLEITNIFSKNGFKACIYLYAPTIAMFDPKVAKWVIFLYCQEKTNSIRILQKNDETFFYPNPAFNTIKLTTEIIHRDLKSYQIFTISGLIVSEGNIENTNNAIQISSLQRGLYFIRFFDKNGISICTNKIIKE
jgi:hypothetical protein